jgi:hypothetical protein
MCRLPGLTGSELLAGAGVSSDKYDTPCRMLSFALNGSSGSKMDPAAIV